MIPRVRRDVTEEVARTEAVFGVFEHAGGVSSWIARPDTPLFGA